MSTSYLSTTQSYDDLSYSRKRQRAETQQQLSNTQNQTMDMATRIRVKREEALRASIAENNLGFKMMKKMGCMDSIVYFILSCEWIRAR